MDNSAPPLSQTPYLSPRIATWRMLRGNRISKSILFPLVGIFIFVLLYRSIYIDIVSPIYAYFGMEYAPSPWVIEILKVVAVTLLGVRLGKELNRPSQLLYWVIFLLTVVPNTFLPDYIIRATDSSLEQNAYIYTLCILFGFYLLGFAHKLPRILIPRVRISPRTYIYSIVIISILFNLYIIRSFGSSMRLVSFADVYSQRDVLTQQMEQFGSMPIYILNWQSNAVNPLLFAYGVFGKRWSLLIYASLGQVLAYSCGANKSMLMSLLLLISLVWVFTRGTPKQIGRLLIWGAAIIMGLVILINFLNLPVLGSVLVALIPMRLFSMTGMLSAQYIRFFSSHPFTMFSHIKGFSFFVPPVYADSIPNLVGYEFYNVPIVSNIHFWGDGYAAMGYAGMLIVTGFMILIFWLIDSLGYRRDLRLVTLMMAMHAITLSNASLFTTFLTNGVGFSLFLLWLMPERLLPAKSERTITPPEHGRSPVQNMKPH